MISFAPVVLNAIPLKEYKRGKYRGKRENWVVVLLHNQNKTSQQVTNQERCETEQNQQQTSIKQEMS